MPEHREPLVITRMTVDIERIATLIEWSHQPYPVVLAPDQRLGRYWLDSINPKWIPGLTRRPYIVSGGIANRALRGLRGDILVVVKAGYRDGEPAHRLNDNVDKALVEDVPLTGMRVWTEYLP